MIKKKICTICNLEFEGRGTTEICIDCRAMEGQDAMDLRRFDITTQNENQKKKFLELVDSKNLSRDELILILSSIKINRLYDSNVIANEDNGRKKYHRY